MAFITKRSPAPLPRVAIGWTAAGLPRTYRLAKPSRKMQFLAMLWGLI